VLPTRLKRHLGTLANATPHLSTCVQLTSIPIPVPQSTALSITACGDEPSSRSCISAIDNNCNSAGSRLVVVRYCNVPHNAWCKGCNTARTSQSTPKSFNCDASIIFETAWSLGTIIGRQERNQWKTLELSALPKEGSNFLGSEDIARTMLGSRPIGLLVERTSETSMVIIGG
jgi:hypothetical protein